MALHSGMEGCVSWKTKGGTDPAVVINISNWNCSIKARLGEATHCGSGGYAVWVPGPKEVSGQFVQPWDDAALVSTSGYVAGAEGDATFKLGDSSLALKGSIIIEETNFEDDAVNGDPVKVTIGYKGNGVFTLETAAAAMAAGTGSGPPAGPEGVAA